MADGTHIEWTDATWQPITGCSVVSPGCTNCYAMKLAGTRLKHHPSRQGLTQDSKAGPVWTGEVRFNEQWLDQPLRWTKPRRIFVCAHGDLFAERVPDEWIDRVFAVMALAPQHTFQVLTKRARRMREYLAADEGLAAPRRQVEFLNGIAAEIRRGATRRDDALARRVGNHGWPVYGDAGDWHLPNVWLGVSVEDQARADERIPLLLQTPAAVRFISAEPLLGPIDLRCWAHAFTVTEGNGQCTMTVNGGANWRRDGIGRPLLDWVITGGEERPRRPRRRACLVTIAARPMPGRRGRFLSQAERRIYRCRRARRRATRLYSPPGRFAAARGRALNWNDAAGIARSIDKPFEHHSDGSTLIRVGKHAAGRLLDGREHSEFPR